MLNIFYGRENINREKFVYQQVKGKTIIIVPDQYTLEAERQALFFLKQEGLMDVQILSLNRLGSKVLEKTGGGIFPAIDKEGRHMLLSKILRQEKENLDVYKNQQDKTSFVEMVNNFISELKQHNVNKEGLAKVIDLIEEDSFLKKKLLDIQKIFACYEKAIAGEYIDSEDYVTLFANKIKKAEFIKENQVIIYGFDYFTPKNLQVISQLIKESKSTTIVLTLDEETEQSRDGNIFAITKRMAMRLKTMGEEQGAVTHLGEISKEFEYKIGDLEQEKSQEIAFLEKEIFALPPNHWKKEVSDIKLVKAANLYLEAETAATYINYLVREKNLRYKDMAVICNDFDTRGNIYKRVFKQFGIDIFMDEKTDISTHPLVVYILTLIELISKNYKKEDVIKLIKTDLTSIGEDTIEDLENYAYRYRVTGGKWKKPFLKGVEGHAWDIEQIQKARTKVIDPIVTLAEKLKEKDTVEAKLRELYAYLRQEANLPKLIDEKVNILIAAGENEAANQEAQIWKLVGRVFEQLIEVLGGEKESLEEIGKLLKNGFDAIELGSLPPTLDGLMMGTMQRTRTGQIKALIILGANQGVLPKESNDVEILSEDEKTLLEERGITLCKMGQLKSEEENLAIYKNISKPTKHLWISCAVSDDTGQELKPSNIFDKVQEIFNKIEVGKDIENSRETLDLVSTKETTLGKMGFAIRETMQGKELHESWKTVVKWYANNHPEDIKTLSSSIKHKVETAPLTRENIDSIYGNPIKVSPSRLERYARCPFAQFVSYGLRPYELKEHKIEAVDMGTIYHQVLMELAQRLTKMSEVDDVTDAKSKWITVTRTQCDEIVKEIFEKIVPDFNDAILKQGKEEKAKAARILQVCRESAWAMVSHVKDGQIKEMLFEEAFGRGKQLPPIEVEVEGQTVFIEGTIDRVDVLPQNNVKILDYKSSNIKFDREKSEKGWTVQLFVYLYAATLKFGEPVGTFYFHIDNPVVDLTAEELTEDNVKEYLENKITDVFKMDGIMVNDLSKIVYIDKALQEEGGVSKIVSAYISKENELFSRSKGKLLKKEDFDTLIETVMSKVKKMSEEIAKGNVAVAPSKIIKGTTIEKGCDFCQYNSICRREDEAF